MPESKHTAESYKLAVKLLNAYDVKPTLYRSGADPKDLTEHGLEVITAMHAFSEVGGHGSIPMLLHCPMCGERHVDKGVWETKLHHTHACQSCGHVWRPAKVATVGVQFLPGYKDG